MSAHFIRRIKTYEAQQLQQDQYSQRADSQDVRAWINRNSLLFAARPLPSAAATSVATRKLAFKQRNRRLMIIGYLLVIISVLLFLLFAFSLCSKFIVRFVLPTFYDNAAVSSQNVINSNFLRFNEFMRTIGAKMRADTSAIPTHTTDNSTSNGGRDDMLQLLRVIAGDWYYTLLFPLLIPALMLFAYFNWLSMKYFRHN